MGANGAKRGLHLAAGLTPSVVRLGLVSFFADVASEMLYPLTPVFLTAVLGAPMAVVGCIEGLAEATASLLKTVTGRLSDRSGRRRPYVFCGYALSAVAKPIIGLAHGWPLVLAGRVGDRFGKGVRTSARDALLADSVPAEVRGRAFGWHRAMDTLGAVVGPLLALVLLAATHNNLRLIFALSFFPGAIGALLVLAVREQRRQPQRAEAVSIGYGKLPPAFRGYLIAWGLFSLSNSSDVFLLLRAKGLGESAVGVVWMYALYNLVYAVASPALGGIADRWGRKKVLTAGLVVFALVYAGFGAATQRWQLWLLFSVYGLYTAATDGVGKALAVELVPTGIQASAVGLLGTVTGLTTLVASCVAGGLWSAVGPWATFAFGAGGAVVGAILLTRVQGTRE
jgi:MFS family permease